jgi:two-component system phosphate regulon sensor histidine kinase PhoR
VFFLLALIVSGYTARNSAKERENSYAELLSLLRHQLHHPSGVIAAIVEVLEHSEGFDKLSAKDKGYIKQLKHENERIHAMISNVLQVAEAKDKADDQEKWGDVNLMVLVNECATNVATAYKRLDDLELNIPLNDAVIRGQADKLQLAFENVLENAFKFSNPGNKVTITMPSKKIPVIEIDIQDHGTGISTKDQRKLFKAFTNIEAADKTGDEAIRSYSMGLGLYISKLIIEQHGGKLELESTLGKGTKVIIRLKRDMWRYYYGQK